MFRKLLFFTTLLISVSVFSQKISLYKQYYGSYDFTMLGNTMNKEANGNTSYCDILTQSSATLNINENQSIIAAYLYWSGNGTPSEADLNVNLNGSTVLSERTNYIYLDNERKHAYFSAFSDVTSIVKQFGKGDYTLSDLDLTNHIARYCGGNYVGWAIAVVYQDPEIKNNLVGIYDGFESLDENNPMVNILLDGFRVTNTDNAKIAFLAWEGDESLSVGEELRINDKLMSNALNPPNNAFNCTNSYSGSTELWNMDLDLYELNDHINVDDTSLDIKITTAADVVLINTIILSVYSVFPDATIALNNYKNYCYQRIIDLEYTVANHKGNHPLKENTPIAFYINNELLEVTETDVEIPIGQEIKYHHTLNIPAKYGYRFDLVVNVDDTGNNKGIVYEIDEENNSSEIHINLAKNCPIQRGVSANFDGLNDGFDISIYDPDNLKIYNRYGKLVYEHGKGYTNQWTGQDNQNRVLPAGTYYYVFTTKYEVFSGYVYLIREVR